MHQSLKLPGDSPLKLIMITFVIIFFVALFAWQIEKYLAVSLDSKLQGQIAKMNMIIEADSLDAFDVSKYAYLHATDDSTKPLDVSRENRNFKPNTTLNALFVKNYMAASGAANDFCYLYVYFPPGVAMEAFDFYTKRDPGYVLAAWSERENAPIAVASGPLNKWAQENLQARHFECNPSELRPNKLATDKNGEVIDLPGIHFQFSDYYFSKVKL